MRQTQRSPEGPRTASPPSLHDLSFLSPRGLAVAPAYVPCKPHIRLRLEMPTSRVLRMFNRNWPSGLILSPWLFRWSRCSCWRGEVLGSGRGGTLILKAVASSAKDTSPDIATQGKSYYHSFTHWRGCSKSLLTKNNSISSICYSALAPPLVFCCLVGTRGYEPFMLPEQEKSV